MPAIEETTLWHGSNARTRCWWLAVTLPDAEAGVAMNRGNMQMPREIVVHEPAYQRLYTVEERENVP